MVRITKRGAAHRCRSLLLFGLMLLIAFSLSLGVSASMDQSSVQTGKVTVQYSGRVTPVALSGTTNVDNILRRMGITLGELDHVEPSLTTRVSGGETIKVTHREYLTQTETGPIAFDTVYLYTTETTPGRETVLTEGADGQGSRTYKRLMEDGKMIEETLVSENLSKEPITCQIAVGFRSKPTSDLDFQWDFDEKGEPLNAAFVLRDQRSTAYTAPPGALTASGRTAQVGHVAVNPNVIPYGSKLFVQGVVGTELVYGYAVAADTGTALLDGRSNLDLYYSTMDEARNHGVKFVDIFVLETPEP